MRIKTILKTHRFCVLSAQLYQVYVGNTQLVVILEWGYLVYSGVLI